MCLRSRHGSAAWFCYALRYCGRNPFVTYECQLYRTGSIGQQHGSSGEKENVCQLGRREADRRMRAEPTNVPHAWPRPRHRRRSASNRTETNDLQHTNNIAKVLRTNPTRPQFEPQPAKGITTDHQPSRDERWSNLFTVPTRVGCMVLLCPAVWGADSMGDLRVPIVRHGKPRATAWKLRRERKRLPAQTTGGRPKNEGGTNQCALRLAPTETRTTLSKQPN